MVLFGLAALLGALLGVFVRPCGQPEQGRPSRRTLRQRASEEVQRVRLEGEIEKARVKATGEIRQEQLDEIERIGENDPAEGRRHLAEWLARNA